MALGNLTNKLATQALNEQVNKVVDVSVPRNPPNPLNRPRRKPPELLTIWGKLFVAELQAMQKALKDDQELVVTVSTGLDTLRVSDVYLPSGQLLVLSGYDVDRNVTRVISPQLRYTWFAR